MNRCSGLSPANAIQPPQVSRDFGFPCPAKLEFVILSLLRRFLQRKFPSKLPFGIKNLGTSIPQSSCANAGIGRGLDCLPERPK
jgi:hypothetical protein